MKIDGKPIVDLPPCQFFINRVTLSPEERTLYDALEQEWREMLYRLENEDEEVTFPFFFSSNTTL